VPQIATVGLVMGFGTTARLGPRKNLPYSVGRVRSEISPASKLIQSGYGCWAILHLRPRSRTRREAYPGAVVPGRFLFFAFSRK